MYHPISDFMANWLNTTYQYLKESGGGPTHPPKPITVGPGVLPTGGYSLVEDTGITYDVPPTQYGTVPLPFNPGSMGLPAIAPNNNDVSEEIAKENPTPSTVSSNFQRLYAGMMNACISDQMHGQNNPNARSACQKLADMGDISEMILTPNQKDAIGLTPLPEQNAKSNEVQLAENEASLTGQIKMGIDEGLKVWSGFAAGTGSVMREDPSGNKTVGGDPGGYNFQSLNNRLKDFLPQVPGTSDLISPVVMIGGAVVLVILLIAIIK